MYVRGIGRNSLGRARGPITAVMCACGCMSLYGWAESRQTEKNGTLSPSRVWTLTVALPWDASGVGSSGWAKALNEKLDLTRRGHAGEQHRYRIRRQHLMLDKHGNASTRSVSEATVKRTLIREDHPGLWTER